MGQPVTDARLMTDALLQRALAAGASDIHLEPTAGALEVRFRIDGLLQTIETLPAEVGRSTVLRLMVMAQLLTYRLDIPQEGRVHVQAIAGAMDLRLAIMPVAHGLRAVLRLPADLTQPHSLETLQLPAGCLDALRLFAAADQGMLLVTGPAGSGKTTTIYALLEYIAHHQPGLSIISLEDPIERLLPGVTQIEVTPHGHMTYDRALQSILRQDPQVLMLGEIRSPATASVAIQAALSGHRLIATLHAGDPATAINRLLEMGIEPYQITSTVFGILSQRLLRKRQGAGYRGRVPVAEFGRLDAPARAAVLQRADADALRKILHAQTGYFPLRHAAQQLAAHRVTDDAELRRVLGEPSPTL